MRITDMIKVENINVDMVSKNAAKDQHEVSLPASTSCSAF